MDLSLLPPLYLIYVANPSDSGKVCVMELPYLFLSYMLTACAFYNRNSNITLLLVPSKVIVSANISIRSMRNLT